MAKFGWLEGKWPGAKRDSPQIKAVKSKIRKLEDKNAELTEQTRELESRLSQSILRGEAESRLRELETYENEIRKLGIKSAKTRGSEEDARFEDKPMKERELESYLSKGGQLTKGSEAARWS